MILITFDYEKRIDSIIKKELDKPIESILKLDKSFGIPEKAQREQPVYLDEEEIEKMSHHKVSADSKEESELDQLK